MTNIEGSKPGENAPPEAPFQSPPPQPKAPTPPTAPPAIPAASTAPPSPKPANIVQQPAPAAPQAPQAPAAPQAPGGNNLDKLKGEFDAASAASGIPSETLQAMAWKESRATPNTPGGGIMQVDPTPKYEGNPTGGAFEQMKTKYPDLVKGDINDSGSNIMAGALYLKEMQEQYGTMELALRAYNSGPNGVDRGNPNATPAGTGDPVYIPKVMEYQKIIESGRQLPP